MKELIDAVKKLAEEELQRGNEMYGKHTSRHQAYAVLLEEVEEARKELDVLGYELSMVWDDVKADKEKLRAIDEMFKGALYLASESIQVAAMVQKFIDYEKENEEQKTIREKIEEGAKKVAEESLEQVKAEELQKRKINPLIKGLYTCKYIESINMDIDEAGVKNIRFKCPIRERALADMDLATNLPHSVYKDEFRFCPKDAIINGISVCYRIEKEKEK